MKVKNNKVYLFTLLILIWNIFLYFINSITIYVSIANYVFWIIILVFCLLLYKGEYNRKLHKSIIFKDIVAFTLIYVIVYYLLGFVFGFKKSPLSFELYNVIKNIIRFVILRGIIEVVKYYLIKENNSKLFITILTIIFILLSVDVKYVIGILSNSRELFKYISGTILPIVMYGIVGTYIILKSDLKTNLLLHLPSILLAYIISISPDLDWYLYGLYQISYLLIVYLCIKYEIDKREETIEVAKRNIVSLIPMMSICVLLVLFVLGIFKYVPLGVMSNSMNPYFERGDIVVYEKWNKKREIQVDDIICYQLDNVKVMHRVVKIDVIDNKRYYTTKGDNISNNDPLKVKDEQIIGTIKHVIPVLGYPSVWLYEILK